MTSSNAIHQLCVTRIKKNIKDRAILQDVSFNVNRGEMFAILGPTGSGKSTLLNIITGRLKCDSGSITVDGRPVDKSLRHRFGYVLQNDVFFANLTLWQTLYFTAQIQMPESWSTTEKKNKLNSVIEAMGLTKCLNTVMGDMFARGLSGGEKKRASIACELLTDPAVLFLDEPTSGLDSSTAWSIMQHLKTEAVTKNRIVISTIHQPSSQMFHDFDRLILITEGKTAYYGRPSDVQSNFSDLGLHCQANYNPADFLLELAKADQATIDKITSNVGTDKRLHNGEQNGIDRGRLNGATELYRKVPENTDHYTNKAFEPHENGTDTTLEMEIHRNNIRTNTSSNTKEARWRTSFFHQFKMLTWRGFIQSKGKIINRYVLAELLIVSLSIAVGYFKRGVGPDEARDIMGLTCITLTYWQFQVTISVIISFPELRPILAKERAAGAYRISALYLSKTVSDIPILLCLAMLVFTINFWIGQQGDGIVYIKVLGVFVLWVSLSQAVGYFIGCAIKSSRLALTVFQAYSISAFLYGGFFIQSIPKWLQWMRYMSIYTYSFSGTTKIILSEVNPISCNTTASTDFYVQQMCRNNTMVTNDVILENAGIDLPLPYYILPIVGIDVVLRLLAYFAMRYRKDHIY